MALTREEATKLAIKTASQAGADLTAGWRLIPRNAAPDLLRSRRSIAQSRALQVPADTGRQVAAALRVEAARRRTNLGTALRLFAASERQVDQARALVRENRLRRSLTAEERAEFLAVARLSAEQQAFLDKYGLGPAGLLDQVEEVAPLVFGHLLDQVHDLVRLRLTAEVSQLASAQRGRSSASSRLSEMRSIGIEAMKDQEARHLQLHKILADDRSAPIKVSERAALVADQSLDTFKLTAPLTIGLDRYVAPSPGRIRYRKDVAQVALSLGSVVRAALLDFAAALHVEVIFGTEVASLMEPWREAAAQRGADSLDLLDGSEGSGSGAQAVSRDVTGVVESITPLQVTREKDIAVIRLRESAERATTLVLPFFNPVNIALGVGSVAQLRVVDSNDVLAEYTNRNTRATITRLVGDFGTTAGAIIARRNLSVEAETSWTMSVARQVRPGFDALPDSLDGRWSLGRWYALSIAAGSLY